MSWKPEIPLFNWGRTTERSRSKKTRTDGRKHEDPPKRRVALLLTVQGAVIVMSAQPSGDLSYVVEEIAGGFELSRIAMRLDKLTSSSPSIWLAAVGGSDVRLAVTVMTDEDGKERMFNAAIAAGTIVPLRAFFDSVGMTMSSGQTADLQVMEGSGPIRVFRKVRHLRRVLD